MVAVVTVLLDRDPHAGASAGRLQGGRNGWACPAWHGWRRLRWMRAMSWGLAKSPLALSGR